MEITLGGRSVDTHVLWRLSPAKVSRILVVFVRLSAYRSDKDSKFARNIELAVHRDLINESSFIRFLDLKAANLAKKLHCILKPFLSGFEETENDCNDASDNEAEELKQFLSESKEFEDDCDDPSDAEADELRGLTEVFRHALRVHCELMGAGCRYACVCHAPGVRFDSTSMEIEAVLDEQDNRAATVELTLLPAIWKLSEDDSMSPDNSSMVEGRECLKGAVVSVGAEAT